MAGSLMDFGDVARTMLGYENLEQTQRHNSILEQNSQLEAGRLEVTREHLKLQQQQAKQQGFTNLMKLADDPRVRANPALSDSVLSEAGKLAGVPDISGETLKRGRDQYRNVLTAIQSGDQEQAHNALVELQVMASPQDSERIVKSVQDVQKISEYSANVEAMRDLQHARFEKIHGAMAKVNAGQIPFAQASQDFSTSLEGTDSPAFKKALNLTEKLRGKDTATSKNIAALVGGSDVEKFTGPAMADRAKRSLEVAGQYSTVVTEAKQALEILDHGGQLPKDVTRQDLQERVLVGKELTQAYSALAKWGQDPFNRENIKEAKAAAEIVEKRRSDLEGLKKATNEEAVQIRRDALTFRKSEAGIQHAHDTAVRQASTWVLENYGYTPTHAQLAEGAKKFDVKPSEIETPDPSKKGKLSLDINEPTAATRTHIQSQLTGVQSTINVIDNLIGTVDQGNIGLAAALKGTAYGFSSQIKGIAEMTGMEASAAKHKNFTPSKWFDPKLSTIDLLANTLAYRIINQEQGGRVSDKDFAEMKKRLNIDSWMAGKEDVVQRLKTMKQQLQFEEGVNRRILKTFSPNQASSGGAVSTAEEYLKSIGFGAGGE